MGNKMINTRMQMQESERLHFYMCRTFIREKRSILPVGITLMLKIYMLEGVMTPCNPWTQ